MNLLKTIIAVGFGIMVFSSQSENLTMPVGELEGLRIDSTKLANEIVQRTESISKVYDLSVKASRFQRWFGGGDFSLSFSVETVSSEIYEDIECSRTYALIGGGFYNRTRNWLEQAPEGSRSPTQWKHILCVESCGNDQVTLDFKTDKSCINMRKIVADVDKGYRDPKRKPLK